MKLKTKQAMANKSPEVARVMYTTVRGIATVMVSSMGMPSVGVPSGVEGEREMNGRW